MGGSNFVFKIKLAQITGRISFVLAPTLVNFFQDNITLKNNLRTETSFWDTHFELENNYFKHLACFFIYFETYFFGSFSIFLTRHFFLFSYFLSFFLLFFYYFP